MRYGFVDPSSWGTMRALIRSSSSRRDRRHKGEILDVALPTIVASPSALVGDSRMDLRDEFLRDDLTELGSVFTLREHLERIVDQFPPFGPRPAVLLVDIDGFARINSTYGPSIGDEVLVVTAARLRRLAPSDGAAYRTGGDEFVVLLDPTTMIDAVAWAGHIHSAVSQPVEVEGSSIWVSACVAVVMLGHRHRVDGILRDADVTMYRAKAEGGKRVDVYNWELDSWSLARKKETERLAREVDELRLQNRVLTEAMTIDPASGMPNSLAFDADHAHLHARRNRTDEPYALLRARIDNFDCTHEHFGSAAATKALISVAHAIRDTVRQSDRAYLLEDGDFAVLLQGSGMQQAVVAAQRVRSRIDSLAAEHPAHPSRQLTVSIAVIEAGFRHSDSKDVLVEVNNLLLTALGSGCGTIRWPQ
jgi:diguanylate cyclase (GGDEF)-like protein